MQLIPYLNFAGDCRQAFDFYQRVLHGRILAQMTYGESPMAGQMPPGSGALIMHAHLQAGSAELMGADGPSPQAAEAASGICINVMVDDSGEAERIFHALAEGGEVTLAMAETFWAHRFGMLVDRYGKPWMVNHLKTP